MFSLFKPATPKAVHIEGLDAPLLVQKGETILQAALRQGVRFPHSCRVGGCASCKCQLQSGKVKELTESAYILSQQELIDGYILACQSVPKTDLTLKVDNLAAGPSHPVETRTGRIVSTQRHTHDIVELIIELESALAYTAGQYALLSVPGVIEQPRSYSFATAPESSGSRRVHFFIRAVPGGRTSNWAQTDVAGTAIQLEGPFGDFHLRDPHASQQPMLCIAGGSGLAPVKALLEDALHFKCNRPVTFLFGARTQRDLYCLLEMQQLEQNWAADFRFMPVLSEEPADSDWTGARGLVTDFIAPHFSSNAQIYMCGPPAMLDAAELQLRQRGIPANQIFSDRFLDQSMLQKSA
ncbi:MAG TPA: 2Fe-2S iron-sulfur cluster binding domain-containing protein [Dongiaceae bacterium]|nr:2Fe-2S iron-sulfur cluster binding domain-containing protein [Dongiaceae bacterium]